MKKIILPAVAALMMAASSPAFAAGPWYVLFNSQTQSCDAAHRVAVGSDEQTLGGPYASQIDALSAIDTIGECGGGM